AARPARAARCAWRRADRHLRRRDVRRRGDRADDRPGRRPRMTIRVLLADDETLIRDAVAALLALQDDLEVVAVAGSGDEALAAALRHQPDVALLDLQMPGLDGLAVAERLAAELPPCGRVLVTSHGRPGRSEEHTSEL